MPLKSFHLLPEQKKKLVLGKMESFSDLDSKMAQFTSGTGSKDESAISKYIQLETGALPKY